MKYAIIRTGGKQYKIAEGDIINVEHLPHAEETVTFSDVLLYALDSEITIGAPLVSDIVVTGIKLGDIKGKKIRVSKFKAKARFRRVTGHRQSLTQVKIESILPKGAKPTKASTAEPEKKAVKKPAEKKA